VNRCTAYTVCFALLACSAPLRADYNFTYTLPPPAWSNVMRDVHMNPMKYQSVTRPGTNRDAGSAGAGPMARQAPTTASLGLTSALTSTVVEPPGRATMPAKIAAHYPSHARTEAERVFRELLSGYGKIEQQFGIPRRDVAGSVAAFLAGSYMAYHNVDFPDEHFKPLVNQVREMIGSNPEFAKASVAEKQEMYEKMAILGMFMANAQMALKEKPNAPIAANMKQAAKGYIEQFLKTDVERVQITAQGLVLR
jgi:hypothetical protein